MLHPGLHRPSRSLRAALLLLAATALVSCETGDVEGEAIDPEDVEPRALLSEHDDYYRVELAPSGVRGQAMRAEAHLVLPIDFTVDAAPAWPPSATTTSPVGLTGTCGVTFVSPHHAITAAHCTQGIDPYGEISLRIPRLARDYDWMSGTAISGTYPSFKHELNPAYGYDEYTCELVGRCGDESRWGEHVGCDITMADVGFPASSDARVRELGDIAMLRCDEPLGEEQGYLDVAESFTTTEPLMMPWYHEVYDPPASNASLQTHYVDRPLDPFTAIEFGQPPNYHYIGGDDRHQLLPLMSTPDGTRWHARVTTGSLISSTLLGCHGTSGSGVMRIDDETGLAQLLGPAVGGSTAIGDRLCYPSVSDETPGLTFAGLDYTRWFADRALVADCLAPPSAYPSVIWYWVACVRGWSIFEDALWWNPFPGCIACNLFSRLRAFQPPVAILATATPISLSLEPQAMGVRYRASVRVYGVELPASVTLRVGNEVIATHQLGANDDEWIGNVPSALLSGSFTASALASGPLTLEASVAGGQGQIGVSDIVLVQDGREGAFETEADRSAYALLADPQAPAEAMRFGTGAWSTHAAILQPGERMFANWQAMIADREWSLTLHTSEGSALACGLVLPDGSEVAVQCSGSGKPTLLDGEGAGAPVGWFVQNMGNDVAVIEDVVLAESASACSGMHDACDVGPALWTGCDACVDAICKADPYCCATAWDGLCVQEVRTVCERLVCDESAGQCSHGVCETGTKLVAGCDSPPLAQSCVSAICGVDTYCCATAWDSICVGEVTSVCQMSCG